MRYDGIRRVRVHGFAYTAEMPRDIAGKGLPAFLTIVTIAMQHTGRDVVLGIGDIERILGG